ncbi:hypothetical protein PROFUN_05338 [Planoprotostelium fungivorum]|uniref:Uncharacterized protein n=1 Tax=Planoprotostelium fungivorum TaxID=1890364 RepID=A0A2P6NR29_9EUKA|nr:hypothetical protein PROFUN_05338 [Planoprotostelium fungivorum]
MLNSDVAEFLYSQADDTIAPPAHERRQKRIAWPYQQASRRPMPRDRNPILYEEVMIFNNLSPVWEDWNTDSGCLMESTPPVNAWQ